MWNLAAFLPKSGQDADGRVLTMESKTVLASILCCGLINSKSACKSVACYACAFLLSFQRYVFSVSGKRPR